MIRFEIENFEATISIYKVPDSPKSFGLIKKSSIWLFSNYPKIRRINANILKNNKVSYKAFIAAGFKPSAFKMYLDNKIQ